MSTEEKNTTQALAVLEVRERSFELDQRELKPFMGTAMIPAHLRDMGSLMILNNVASKYKMDLLFLAQEMYIVKGKFAISGKLAIALINKSGQIDGRLGFEVRDQPFGVRAYAKIDGETVHGMWIDDNMIRLNAWERNPLWKTQKELMARYRSATYFARMEMPDVLMGFHTDDEIQDMTDLSVEAIEPTSSINTAVVEDEPQASEDHNVIDASLEEETGINGAVGIQETAQTDGDVLKVGSVYKEPTITAEKPKHRRACKAVSIHYPRMEDHGVKRGHLAKIVQYFDLTEANIDKFMIDLDKYINEFYASHEDLSKGETTVEAPKEEVDDLNVFDTEEETADHRFDGEKEHPMVVDDPTPLTKEQVSQMDQEPNPFVD